MNKKILKYIVEGPYLNLMTIDMSLNLMTNLMSLMTELSKYFCLSERTKGTINFNMDAVIKK